MGRLSVPLVGRVIINVDIWLYQDCIGKSVSRKLRDYIEPREWARGWDADLQFVWLKPAGNGSL